MIATAEAPSVKAANLLILGSLAATLFNNDNNITAFAELPANANNSDSFASEKDLAKLTKDWSASRLAEVWNGFAGAVPFDDLKPVKNWLPKHDTARKFGSSKPVFQKGPARESDRYDQGVASTASSWAKSRQR